MQYGRQKRLKSSYDISGFSGNIQKILRALKKFDVIIADTRSSMFILGQHHDYWDDESSMN